MRAEQDGPPDQDPRVRVAITELKADIVRRHPAAAFEVFQGEDPAGTYLRAIVEVEDTDEVVEPLVDRLLALQVDQELHLQLVVTRPAVKSRRRLKARPRARERV